MLKPLNRNLIGKNILLTLGFGFLSFLLGFLKFHIPGMDGGGSDMREIGILLSVIFIPNWVYMLGVSFIASINIPFNNIEVSTTLMHITASLFAWFYYNHLLKKINNQYWIGALWVIMVISYYTVFLIPTLVIVYYLYSVIDASAIIATYKNVLYAYRFELFASTAISGLFLGLYKTTIILKSKNKELEKALLKSEESDRLKTAFLNNINHEIRTPLNGITGFSMLITDPNLSDAQRKSYSNLIQNCSNQLMEVISNIIELSRIRASKLDIKLEQFPINDLLEDIHNRYLPLSHMKKLQFEVALKDDDNIIIVSDRKLLNQILESLLNNAFKFTHEGFVRLSYRANNEFIIFDIEDSGPGIEKSLHEKIFENFSKFDINDGKLHEGAGLGLAITKELLKPLGGTIRVASEVGKGSIFSISIPSNKLLTIT